MATAQQGTWWRLANQGTLNEFLLAAVMGPTRTIFVGEDSGSPIIYTFNTLEIDNIPLTHSQKTPAGVDPLRGVDYASDISEAVAVGDNGSVETSINEGLSWTSQILSGAADLRDVVAVAGATSRFVVAGIGVIWGRDAGGTWTTRWTGAQQWFTCAYRAGAGWVVMGNAGWATQSPTAANGTFITPYQPLSWSGPFNQVRANTTHFLAVSTGGHVFRSATGLSGSWTQINIGENFNLTQVVPMADTNEWAISDESNRVWYSSDNGDNWTRNEWRLIYVSGPLARNATHAVAGGGFGTTYVSTDQFQADYVDPSVELSVPPPAFTANADMSGDAVRRLVGQFRSGRG